MTNQGQIADLADLADLKQLIDRVLNDRRFCSDEFHKTLAEGAKGLIAESDRLKTENKALRAEKRTIECRHEVSEDTLKTIRRCLHQAEQDIDQLMSQIAALRAQ
ncbi:hypothetical protein [Pseudomonas sp. DSP3-2-2]|uniref:hypothetical protein n=1 Tax=unclassified Pseudomonas TaxID=196821 RepID=UPI003CE89417